MGRKWSRKRGLGLLSSRGVGMGSFVGVGDVGGGGGNHHLPP